MDLLRREKRWIILCCLLPLWLSAQPGASPPVPPLVLTHVAVIDGTGAPPKRDMTVTIIGGRIAALGKTGKAPVPRQAQVIDASGKFLIPGLWDMHVHTLRQGRPEIFFPLLLANGITGVRDMGGDLLAQIPEMRKRIALGALQGPRIFAAGPVLDGPKEISAASIAVSNGPEGRQSVAALKTAGADFVKVYALLPREAYFAVADEARKQSIPFCGHVPYSISAAEASDAGQKSIEHLNGVLLACSAAEKELRDQLAAAVTSPDTTSASLSRLIDSQTDRLLTTFSEKKAASLFTRFARNGTWQCPTLVVLRAFAFLDDPGLTEDARLKYVPLSMRERWGPGGHLHSGVHAAENFARRKKIFQRQLGLVAEMRRAGIPFLAGTDSPTPYVVPGFSLHDELALLVQAELTPMEALQAATRNAARYLGILDSVGTVETGKIADLVLLEADPLQDITNSRKISAVVLGGKLISLPSLQQMLAAVERAAQSR